MMKKIQDNDMTDCISAIYAKNDIEFLWSIGLSVDCDEDQIGQVYAEN